MPPAVEKMAFRGATPWHRMGDKMEDGLSLEEWIKRSGMEYTILAAPSEYTTFDGVRREFENRFTLYRSDTMAPLSHVSGGYNIVQPSEVMEFFREATEKAELRLDTAGVLQGGAVYWALASTTDSFDLKVKDTTHRIEAKILLVSSADKSFATTGKLTTINVVCLNTLRAAVAQRTRGHKVTHSSKFDDEAKAKIRAAVGMTNYEAEWAMMQTRLSALVETPITDAQAEAFFKTLLRQGDRNLKAESFADLLKVEASLKGENKAKTDGNPRAVRGLAPLMDAYRNAPGADPGSAFGALQATTFYVDHMRGTDADKRMYSSQFSQGASFKDRSFELATLLAKK